MKQIILYIMCIMFVGCNPCKRLIKLCPPNDSISYIETIDTILIPVYIPSSSMDVEIPLGSLGFVSENEDQKLDVQIRNDTIYIKSICKEDSLKIENYQLRKQLAAVKTRIERVEIPTYVIKNSKYHSIAGIIAPILLLLIAGGIYLKIKKVV